LATKAKKRKVTPAFDETEVKSEWDKILDQIKEKPLVYGGCVVFLILCVFVGFSYRFSNESNSKEDAERYIRAFDNEDAQLRSAALEKIADQKDALAAQELYMAGESAIEAKEYEKARELFKRLRQEYPDSPFMPDALEGLGFLAENEDNFELALENYNKVMTNFPDSLAARRQYLNIGRCQEQLGKLEEAVTAYQTQEDKFPDSGSAAAAKAEIERLRRTHPDLFPEETPAEDAGATPAAVETPAETPEAAPETTPTETPPVKDEANQ